MLRMSCDSSGGMETFALLVNGIVKNALLHSNSHINQTQPQIVPILLFSGRLAARDFVMKLLGSGLFGSQKSGSS